jgi:putative pyruvate formate lyase activating enzyme
MNSSLQDALTHCEFCPRACRVDRTTAPGKFCRTGSAIQVAHIGLHFGEEPPISGTRGSGTVFFTGCNLRCVFCQNYQISQEFQSPDCRTLTIDDLAEEMLHLQGMGAHNVNFVSPTHMILLMAEAIEKARQKGFSLPVVYNSNGYDSIAMLQRIRGLVDIYLPDIKYMDDEPARKYSSAPRYAEIIPGVLEEMLAQVGHLEVNGDGIATRGLLVRHLVLPGLLDNSRKCLDTLAGLSRYTHLSLMSQYSPQYKAALYPEINRSLSQSEYEQMVDYAWNLGLKNVFIQEIESQEKALPDFKKETPFDFSSIKK